MPVRVVFADDSLIIRSGVSRLLAGDPSVDVVAVAADVDTLRAAVAERDPDVVVTDIRMPPEFSNEGIRVAQELAEQRPRLGVVVLSQFADPIYALALFEGGADRRAYLLKERVHDRMQLSAAIHAVAGGGSVIDPRIVEELVRSHAQSGDSPLDELTSREREVLIEIAQGKSNSAIADSLFLTKRAVEKHINSIFLKLGFVDEEEISKRVKAALILLAERDRAPEAPDAP